MHRKHEGKEYEGDWAWGPPAGARFPNEPVEDCAKRELFEETGLQLPITLTTAGTDDWPAYLAEAAEQDEITISDEHDRYEWLLLEDALTRCKPFVVAEQLRKAASLI